MNQLTEAVRKRNASTRGAWDASREHREHVTDQITRGVAAEGNARVCVLGAGNCNEIDLGRLIGVFAEVHLVDLDGDAMRAGVERQGLSADKRVVLHADVDLTGVCDDLSEWSSAVPTEAQVDALIAQTQIQTPPDLGGPFDVVASVSVLSQLILHAVEGLGESHARLQDVVVAIRAQHLRLLFDLTKPGGYGLLVTDVFSSETAPSLGEIDYKLVPGLVQHMAKLGNHFHGLHPTMLISSIISVLDAERTMPSRQVLLPWRWNMGARYYAMMAFKFRRADDA